MDHEPGFGGTALVLLCGLLAGCGRPAHDGGEALVRPAAVRGTVGASEEPIALMWQVQGSGPQGDFALLRRLGINTVQSSRVATWPEPEARAWLDAAGDAGLRAILYLGTFREGAGPDCRYAPAAARIVAALRGHPALFAWHSLDEPAGHRIAPSCQRALYAAIKGLDPDRPVMVSTNNHDASAYDDWFAEDAFDLYEVHKYVNPHPGADQHRLLELLATRRTRDYPVIVTLRAFNAPGKLRRRDMVPGSLDAQYDAFIERPGITRNVGFYGWELAPNRGIRDDPAIRREFEGFMERRFREPGPRMR